MSAGNNIKLTYFNAAGIAQPIRIALHIAGIPFEDILVDGENWPAMKPTTPLGFLPVLEVDGVKYPNSVAFLRFAGRHSDLYPADPEVQLRIDGVLACASEFFMQLGLIRGAGSAKEKALMWRKLRSDFLPSYLKGLENMMTEVPGPFLLGSKLSIADLFLSVVPACFGTYCPEFPVSILNEFPTLKALNDNVKAEPRVAAYLALPGKSFEQPPSPPCPVAARCSSRARYTMAAAVLVGVTLAALRR